MTSGFRGAIALFCLFSPTLGRTVDQKLAPAPAAGDVVRPFTIQTRSGSPFTWAAGRTTVVCFCAMWCDTWKEQLPRLKKSEVALRGLPVDYLAIAVDGRWLERVEGTANANLLSDPGGHWSEAIGIDRVPYTLVIDAKGIVRWSAHGILRSEDVVHEVQKALLPRTAGRIFLTFDGVTDELLDVLRKAEIPATFFVSNRDGAAMVRRARLEGHRIDNSEKSKAVIGKRFRDDPYDLTRPGEKELTRRILNNARDGAVIVLHAGVSDTLAELPRVIENLRIRGFQFGPLP